MKPEVAAAPAGGAGAVLTAAAAAAAGVTSAPPARVRDCCPTPGGCRARPAGVQAGAPRGCVVGSYDGDFEHIASRLRDVSGPGFAMARYADGERQLAYGEAVQNIDGWVLQHGAHPKLQAALLASLRGHFGEEYYYGFAGAEIDVPGTSFFLAHTEQTCGFVTFANLFVNSHIPKTAALFDELAVLYRNRTVLVTNGPAQASVRANSAIGKTAVDALGLDPLGVLSFEDDAYSASIIARARALASQYDGHLFVVSGGPLAKILIAEMWDANCRNRYVDFGSSVDNVLAAIHTRDYAMQPDADYGITRAGGVFIAPMA